MSTLLNTSFKVGESRMRLKAVLGKAASVAFGIGVALALMELLLRAKPSLVPREVPVNPPVRRVQAFRDEAYEVKRSQGDLYYWMQGAIAPVQPDQDRVVARVHLTTDVHGFRNPLPERATYDIIALGDSFTLGLNVASPWPQQLAEYTGLSVLNLGESALGPQQELSVLKRYGLEKHPQWVIMAYFGGNDLYDAGEYAQAQPLLVLRLGRYLLTRSMQRWNSDRSDAVAGVGDNPSPSADLAHRYPITVTVGDAALKMAFFSGYVAWLSPSHEAIESSRNYGLVKETILQARDLSEASGARFLLVYVPSKPQVYLPYVNGAEILERVFVDVNTVGLNEAGFLEFTSQAATPELVCQHMDDQARLLADFAAEQGIDFLDLTPHSRVEAKTGIELYYPFDTHWKQRGHDLAAQVIAQHLRGESTNPVAIQTPGATP